jgi:ZIP family zinc transporter
MNYLEQLTTSSPFLAGLLASVLAGSVATTLGAVPIAFVRPLSDHATNVLLSFAAGIMLAATMFSLLLPGFEAARSAGDSATTAASVVLVAMALGGMALWLAHRYAPHEHFSKGSEGVDARRFSRIWLFVIAIVIHNFPEGLAVGVGAASGDLVTGLGVTIGIGLQNLPEGLAVAAGLIAIGYSRGTAFLAAVASGLVEPVGGAIGAGAVALSSALLPWALGFAGGAMLFVISSEVIPETHRPGYERGATAALFTGFGAMFFLAATLS